MNQSKHSLLCLNDKQTTIEDPRHARLCVLYLENISVDTVQIFQIERKSYGRIPNLFSFIDVMVRELNLKFKLAIQQKGGVGIRSLRRIFNQMDFNGNKKLDLSEFE